MDSESIARRAAMNRAHQLGLSAVLETATRRRESGGDGAIIKGLREELEEAKRKLLHQEAEVKQAKAVAVKQVGERARQWMILKLGEIKKKQEEEKRELRDQLQTAKDHAEGLSKKMAGKEGALDLKMTEVETLAGEVQSFLEQLKEEAVSRKSLILTKDRENDKLVGELKRKDEMIQELSKKMEALKQVHEEESRTLTKELARERLSAQRNRIELGQKLLNCRVQDIAAIGTELATQLVNVKEEEVTDPAGDSGNKDEGEDEASHSSPESMDMTESESEEEVAPSDIAGVGYSLRRNRQKRSYAEIADSDPDEQSDFESESATWKGSTRDFAKRLRKEDTIYGDETDLLGFDDEEELEPEDLEGMPQLSPQT